MSEIRSNFLTAAVGLGKRYGKRYWKIGAVLAAVGVYGGYVSVFKIVGGILLGVGALHALDWYNYAATARFARNHPEDARYLAAKLAWPETPHP